MKLLGDGVQAFGCVERDRCWIGVREKRETLRVRFGLRYCELVIVVSLFPLCSTENDEGWRCDMSRLWRN